MAEEKNICASCGSANAPEASICDTCGENLTLGTPAAAPDFIEKLPAAKAPPVKAAAAAPLPRRQAPQVQKKNTARQTGQVSAGAMFSTMQWIAITIAAFILGGVVTAAFLQSTATAPSAVQDESGMTQQDSQLNIGRLNEAKAALDANPDDQAAILVYANALHDAKMLDQAIAQYKRYLLSDPDNADARVDLGICYFEKQEFDSAIAEMERAVAKHPEHQLGMYNLGIVNLNSGNKEKAREWFTRARDFDPNSAYGQNAAKLLNEQF
ncbi:MAG: tetratricopeptide repeat protein [Bacteroidota bacterium]